MDVKKVSKRVVTNRWFLLIISVSVMYSLAGFFLTPYLAQYYLKQYTAEHLGHDLAMQDLRFNPFIFAAEVDQFRIQDQDRPPLFTLGFASANFDLFASAYYRAWTFSQIKLADPHFNIVIDENGRINLHDLFPSPEQQDQRDKQDQDDRVKENDELTRLLLEQVAISGGEINLIDRRKTPPADMHLRSLTIDLDELTTLPERTGGYAVSGRTQAGGRFQWRGRVSLNPIWSEGSIRVNAMTAATVWEFLKRRICCEKPPGEVTLSSDYVVDFAGAEPALKLSAMQFDVSNLSLTPRGGESPVLALKNVNGTGGTLRWNERAFSFDAVRVKEGLVRADIADSGLANWQGLLGGNAKGPDPHASDISQEASAKSRDGSVEKPLGKWAVSLGLFELIGFQINVKDMTVNPPAEVTMDPVDLALTDISTDPNAVVAVDLYAPLKDKGVIRVTGKTKPWIGTARGHVSITGVSLLPFQPYVSRLVRLTLKSGRVDASGNFAYGDDVAESGGKFTYQGEANIDSLWAHTDTTNQPLFGWDALSCPDIKISLFPNVLEFGLVRAMGPSGSLIIYEDGSINLSRIMAPGEKKKHQEQPEQETRITVEQIRMEEGSLAFADLSLSSLFRVRTHQLHGSLTGISSIPDTVANVDLQGEVESHAMVEIAGETDLFNPTGTTDITMDFRNLDMTKFTPYSVRFAGYRIASGKLTLHLKYSIQNGKMVGENQIIAERFTLGERVESPSAMDLPFELAIALLKNSKGVIDIGLSVSGDLDNPQFDFGEVIRKALGNLLTKIVSAPFSWLASLIGSEKEDLDRIFFNAGESTLLPPAKEKLTELSTALAQRPQLRLQIAGSYEPAADKPVLRAEMMRRILASQKSQTAPEQELGPVVFHDPDTQKAVETLFLEGHSAAVLSELWAEYQKGLGTEEETREAGAQAARSADFYKDLYRRMEENVNVSEIRFKTLAEKRAAAVRDFLVNAKNVDPKRIVLLEPVQTDSADRQDVATKLDVTA